MKKFYPSISLFLIVLLFSTSTCEKSSEPEIQYEDYAVFDISSESEWDYWLISNEDQSYLLVEEGSSLPTKVFFRPNPDYEGYPIFIDERGLPEKAIINDYIFLFDNFSGNTMDIAIIDPSGNIQVERGIESEYNFDEIGKKSAASIQGWHEALKFVSIAASVATCGIGIITAPAGIGLAIAAVGCGATALVIGAELMPDDQEILGLSGQSIGAFASTLGCITQGGVTCALGVLSEAATITDSYISMSEDNQETISEAETQLSNVALKSGDFAITAGRYGINEDWSIAVDSELGSNYRPLDWTELKEYYNQGGDMLALFDDLGLTEYRNGAAILRNGKQCYSSTRGYFASRHEHNKPSNYLAHENIDNYLISLGSWDGERKILAIKK